MSATTASPPCFVGLEKDQYYLILCNICYNSTQYYRKLTLPYYSPRWNPALPVKFQSGNIEPGQDVSIGRNYHLVPGPKEPFTKHLGLGVIII